MAMVAACSLSNCRLCLEGTKVDMANSKQAHPDGSISKQEIETALQAILNSEIFHGAIRLQEILNYVVTETIAGNDSKILAKTIAYDVYNRAGNSIGESENVVRVDAGRLRRQLELYYLKSGSHDPVRIYIDTGGYAPRFERHEADVTEASDKTKARYHPLLVGVLLAGMVVLGGAVFLNWPGVPDPNTVGVRERANHTPVDNQAVRRGIIYDHSPNSLQAINLAGQAHQLIMPMFDKKRLLITLDMFRKVIEMDDEYFGGYSGTAQVMGYQAFLAPASTARKQRLAEARKYADKAVGLNRTSAWTQSASAWVSFVEGDYERAMRTSKIAVQIDPENGHALQIHGQILLFGGEFEAAIQATDPALPAFSGESRFANRNIRAAASFYVGDYVQTIKSLNTAIESGGPAGLLGIAYLAAANQALGNNREAKRLVDKLSKYRPLSRVDIVLKRVFRYPEHADKVIKLLLVAGWKPLETDANAETGQLAN
jgi:tetratricopeptide (TPR) repeat protein